MHCTFLFRAPHTIASMPLIASLCPVEKKKHNISIKFDMTAMCRLAATFNAIEAQQQHHVICERVRAEGGLLYSYFYISYSYRRAVNKVSRSDQRNSFRVSSKFKLMSD